MTYGAAPYNTVTPITSAKKKADDASKCGGACGVCGGDARQAACTWGSAAAGLAGAAGGRPRHRRGRPAAGLWCVVPAKKLLLDNPTAVPS